MARFDWQTWLDAEREKAERRLAMSRPDLEAESPGYIEALVADDRYSRALEVWSRHRAAIEAVAAAREAAAAAERDAREFGRS